LSTLITSVEKLQTTLDAHLATLQTLMSSKAGAGVDDAWRNEMGQIRDEIKSVKGIMLGP
jgi:hypothetical protein